MYCSSSSSLRRRCSTSSSTCSSIDMTRSGSRPRRPNASRSARGNARSFVSIRSRQKVRPRHVDLGFEAGGEPVERSGEGSHRVNDSGRRGSAARATRAWAAPRRLRGSAPPGVPSDFVMHIGASRDGAGRRIVLRYARMCISPGNWLRDRRGLPGATRRHGPAHNGRQTSGTCQGTTPMKITDIRLMRVRGPLVHGQGGESRGHDRQGRGPSRHGRRRLRPWRGRRLHGRGRRHRLHAGVVSRPGPVRGERDRLRVPLGDTAATAATLATVRWPAASLRSHRRRRPRCPPGRWLGSERRRHALVDIIGKALACPSMSRWAARSATGSGADLDRPDPPTSTTSRRGRVMAEDAVYEGLTEAKFDIDYVAMEPPAARVEIARCRQGRSPDGRAPWAGPRRRRADFRRRRGSPPASS